MSADPHQPWRRSKSEVEKKATHHLVKESLPGDGRRPPVGSPWTRPPPLVALHPPQLPVNLSFWIKCASNLTSHLSAVLLVKRLLLFPLLHLLLQLSVVGSLLPWIRHVSDVVLDRLLNTLVCLESDVRIPNQARPDPSRLGPGRSSAAWTSKSQRVSILLLVPSSPGQGVGSRLGLFKELAPSNILAC